MRAGIIQQVDTPKTLYEDPANLFVAGFIGSPAMNFMPARLENGKLRLPFGEVSIPRGVGEAKGRDVIAGIRPEHFEDARFEDREATDRLRFTARPEVVESMGSELYAYFDIEGESVRSEHLDELAADAGMDDVPGAGTAVVARLDAASDAAPGKDVELSLDTGKIKLFDQDGGRSLTSAG
jgi:multiple sugar transport system ATP-binding protein